MQSSDAHPQCAASLMPWAATGSGDARRRWVRSRGPLGPGRPGGKVGAPGECGLSHNTSMTTGRRQSKRPGRLVAGRTHAQGSPFLAGTIWGMAAPLECYRGDRTRTCDIWFWRPALYQLSYAPPLSRIVALPRMLSQRHALGLLFLALALGFAFIAYASGQAGFWVIAVPAAALGGWMLTMSWRLLRRR